MWLILHQINPGTDINQRIAWSIRFLIHYFENERFGTTGLRTRSPAFHNEDTFLLIHFDKMFGTYLIKVDVFIKNEFPLYIFFNVLLWVPRLIKMIICFYLYNVQEIDFYTLKDDFLEK